MRKRHAVLAFAVSGLGIAAVKYGGWAIVSVDNPPEYLVAGKPTELTFDVRQHAVTPRGGLTPAIEARSGARVVHGMTWELRRTGAYAARITVPTTGEWQIRIHSGFGISAATLLPLQAIEPGAHPPAAFAQADRGRVLFAAKGCVTCHVHGDVPIDGQMKTVGPELTGRRFPAEYLERFLRDPSIKPPMTNGYQMPNPQLQPPEIASIIAFINGERRVANR